MNLSVYLPDNLKNELESFVAQNKTTKNAAIRMAVEMLLNQERKTHWGEWMSDFQGDPAIKEFESFRSELKEPTQELF